MRADSSQSAARNSKQVLDAAEWTAAYGDYLFRFAQSRLRDRTAAEEAVQETFLAAIRYQHQFRGEGSQRGWLLGILKRKIVDQVRQRSRETDLEAMDDPDGEETIEARLFDESGAWREGARACAIEPGRQLDAQDLLSIIRHCLSLLPIGQADAFVLSAMDGLKTDEICNTLGITPSNLWVRLHRARLSLAGCVGPRWHVPLEQ